MRDLSVAPVVAVYVIRAQYETRQGSKLDNPADVVSGWERAWNAADVDALADLFADDAEFVNVVGLWWHDKTNIRAAHAFGFAKIFPESVIKMGTPRVRLVGTDAALVQSQWHLTGQVSPTGEPAGDREGIFTFVLEKRGADWITVAAHNTDIARGKQTHINSDSGSATIHYEKRDASWDTR